MAEIHIHRAHHLGLAAARKIAFQWAEQVEQEFDMECVYEEGKTHDRVQFERIGVSGTLDVTQDDFELKAKLGFLLGAFKAKIEEEIVKNLDQLLAHKPAAAAKPAAAKAPAAAVAATPASAHPAAAVAAVPPPPAKTTNQPAPVPAAPAAPALAKAPVAKPAAVPAAPAAASDREIDAAVKAWASAWAARDLKTYLGSYAKDFATPGGVSRSSWEDERRKRIVGKSNISVRLSNVVISSSGNKATVKFRQDYKAGGLAVSSRKLLELARNGNRWQITREAVVD